MRPAWVWPLRTVSVNSHQGNQHARLVIPNATLRSDTGASVRNVSNSAVVWNRWPGSTVSNPSATPARMSRKVASGALASRAATCAAVSGPSAR